MSWWLPIVSMIGLLTYAGICITVQTVRAAERARQWAEIQTQRAEEKIQKIPEAEVLLGACIDYRNTLIRSFVRDSISGRPGGVEEMCKRLGIDLPPRSLYGERP